MLSKEDVLAKAKSNTLDGRDMFRLSAFFPVSDYAALGLEVLEGAPITAIRPWAEEEIKKQLAADVAFGFEKALNKRGISASLMYEVVKMWMWVLEDPLKDFEGYAQYGLPFFKAVALKYDLPNPIGDKRGDEYEFSSGYDG